MILKILKGTTAKYSVQYGCKLEAKSRTLKVMFGEPAERLMGEDGIPNESHLLTVTETDGGTYSLVLNNWTIPTEERVTWHVLAQTTQQAQEAAEWLQQQIDRREALEERILTIKREIKMRNTELYHYLSELELLDYLQEAGVDYSMERWLNEQDRQAFAEWKEQRAQYVVHS